MDFLGALTGGALNLVGGIMNNRSNAKQQETANWQNLANQREQNSYNTWQSDRQNAYSTWSDQRAMDYNQAMAIQNRDYQTESNAKAMSFSSDEALKNRAWQQSMSNTAHQREVSDLRAAGLNPILSGSGGMGAATGSGASASGVSSAGAVGAGASHAGSSSAAGAAHAGAARTENVIGPAVNTALQTYRGLTEMENVQASTGKVVQDTETSRAQGILYSAQAEASLNNMGLTNAQKEHYRALIDEIYQGKMPGYQASRKRDLASAGLMDEQKTAIPSEIQRNRAQAQASSAQSLLTGTENMTKEELLKLVKQDVGHATDSTGDFNNAIARHRPLIELIKDILGTRASHR